MSAKTGEQVSMLKENREISRRRLWAIRVVFGGIALLQVGNVLAAGPGANIPGLIGFVIGVWLIYWFLLWVFSSPRADSD